MAITKPKRKKMETLIYTVFSDLDPTGINTEKYKKMFSKMSDAEFEKFFKKLFNSDDYLLLDVVDYERDLKIEFIEKAANTLKVPLFEEVVMPFVNKDKKNPIISKAKVPVGYVHLKPLQQFLRKKNGISTEIGMRSATTAQVINKDKNARETDVENFALVTLNATNNLREMMGPRSDDMAMKNDMYSAISRKGYVSLEELPNNIENKTTLNTIDVYLISMGIKSDLITNDLVLYKKPRKK